MADNPIPTPQSASNPVPGGGQPQPTNSPQHAAAIPPDGIQPESNGASPTTFTAESPAPTKESDMPPLVERLKHLGMHAAVLAVLWVGAFVILLALGQQKAEAIGFACVIALVGSFFSRSLVPALAEKPKTAQAAAPHHQPADSAREVIETIVFVVVLVLLLKSFVAEAFVIPTGSMAETLLGYQKMVTCPQCKLEFPLNCSSEVDPQDGKNASPVLQCVCPNCQAKIEFLNPRDPRAQLEAQNPNLIPDPGWKSGDRVLVAKYAYEMGQEPERLDVVVFKFPGNSPDDSPPFPASGPVKKHVPMNYIKRLIGLPGQIIAIHRGKIYFVAAGKGPRYPDQEEAAKTPGGELLLWQIQHTHRNLWPSSVGPAPDPEVKRLWDEKKFEIIRKSPANILAMRRLVYDNDHQAADLTGEGYMRWLRSGGWKNKDRTNFEHDGAENKGFDWLRYRHVLRNHPGEPQLITDFMGYNTSEGGGGMNWTTDLMVECEVQSLDGIGTFALELSCTSSRFQAQFDLSTGKCTLYRIDAGEDGERSIELGKVDTTPLKGKGKHLVRFANVDERLLVWVDERLPFGEKGVPYDPIRGTLTPDRNDVERPVSVGANGAKVLVSKLKVFRDTYYTTGKLDKFSDSFRLNVASPEAEATVGKPTTWPVSTYYVQPGHYMCMGDNSPASSDSRSWGLVPRRLLLGRALLVYYPFGRAGRIR